MQTGPTKAGASLVVALLLGLASVIAGQSAAVGQATTTSAQECHPDYVDPCIPFLPGDALDCEDVGPIVILADATRDPYQLDDVGVGDGIGCDDFSTTAVESVVADDDPPVDDEAPAGTDSDRVDLGEPVTVTVTSAPVVEAPADTPDATAVAAPGFTTTRKIAIGALGVAAIIGIVVALRGGLRRAPTDPAPVSVERTATEPAAPPPVPAPTSSEAPAWVDITWVDRDRVVNQPVAAG